MFLLYAVCDSVYTETCEESVRGKSVGYLFVRRTMTATLKRTSGGVLLCEGLRYCCVGRQQSVQTSICCGNDGMTLNAQVFANDG